MESFPLSFPLCSAARLFHIVENFPHFSTLLPAGLGFAASRPPAAAILKAVGFPSLSGRFRLPGSAGRQGLFHGSKRWKTLRTYAKCENFEGLWQVTCEVGNSPQYLSGRQNPAWISDQMWKMWKTFHNVEIFRTSRWLAKVEKFLVYERPRVKC